MSRARSPTSSGRLHVLVNNAGVIARRSVTEATLRDWHRVMDVNVTGAFLGIRQLAPLIRDSGGGAIVNVSSTAGLIAHIDAAYTASKWALRGLTKAAALDLVRWNIRVNSVHPATVATALTDAGPAGHLEANRRAIPMGTRGVGRGSGRGHIVSRVGPIVVRDRRRDACRRRIEFSRRGVDARSYPSRVGRRPGSAKPSRWDKALHPAARVCLRTLRPTE